MRRIYNPSTGADVTSVVQGYLTSGQTFVFADLYSFFTVDFINANPDGGSAWWTYADSAFPIFVKQFQIGWLPGSYVPKMAQLGPLQTNGTNLAIGLTFQPEVISHNNLTYEVGFSSNPVEVTWAIDETKSYGPWSWSGVLSQITPVSNCLWPHNLTLKQAMLLGIFDMVPFWVHRAIFYPDFPTRGGSFVGTTLLHRGYLKTVAGSTDNVKIKIDSLMQVFQDTQVPVQTIMPNSRSMLFVPAPAGGISLTNPVAVNALDITVTGTLAQNQLTDYWISFCPGGGVLQNFTSGNPLPPLFRVRGNSATSGGTATINFYEPYVMGNSPVVNLYGQNQFSNTLGAPGFPYVPAAETTLGGVLNQGQGGGKK
jgi:hypothetical protein